MSALGVLPSEAAAPRPRHAVSPQAELCVPIKHWGDPSAGAAIEQRRASYGYDVHIVMSTKATLGAGAAIEQRRAAAVVRVRRFAKHWGRPQCRRCIRAAPAR